MSGRGLGGAAAGFSLLELLVASTCSALIAGAVFALMVGSAATSRREWGGVAARRAAGAAVAMLADDLSRAGTGLEAANRVQRDGASVAYASSSSGSHLRVVLARGVAAEVVASGPGVTYTVHAAQAIRVGDSVAAVGLTGRPAAQPLPLGVVAALAPRGGYAEVLVAWRPAEAAVVAAWGAPRALLPVNVREYDVRRFDGALQLGRRTDAGTRQPIADGLDGFRIDWVVDSDGDGRADAVRQRFSPGGAARACAARVEVSMKADARSATVAGLEPAVESAVRWVTLGAC